MVTASQKLNSEEYVSVLMIPPKGLMLQMLQVSAVTVYVAQLSLRLLRAKHWIPER